MTTKSARIMELHARGLSTRAIAIEVYGDTAASHLAYVRIVAFQRKGSGMSEADHRYVEANRAAINDRVNRWQKHKYRTNHAWRKALNERRAAAMRQRYATDPEYRKRVLENRKAVKQTEEGRAAYNQYMRDYMRNRRKQALADSPQIS